MPNRQDLDTFAFVIDPVEDPILAAHNLADDAPWIPRITRTDARERPQDLDVVGDGFASLLCKLRIGASKLADDRLQVGNGRLGPDQFESHEASLCFTSSWE